LGYGPVGDYAATVTEEVGWMVDQVARDATWTPPGVEPETSARWFDYATEDASLRTIERAST
jgi:hypothetical protein